MYILNIKSLLFVFMACFCLGDLQSQSTDIGILCRKIEDALNIEYKKGPWLLDQSVKICEDGTLIVVASMGSWRKAWLFSIKEINLSYSAYSEIKNYDYFEIVFNCVGKECVQQLEYFNGANDNVKYLNEYRIIAGDNNFTKSVILELEKIKKSFKD
jgi:hypothetical protein